MPHGKKGHFLGGTLYLPAVHILSLIQNRAAAMRPLATSTVATYLLGLHEHCADGLLEKLCDMRDLSQFLPDICH